MSSPKWCTRCTLLVLACVLGISAGAFAGPTIVGSVGGSVNATLGGQAILPNSTVFSGETLVVNDGTAIVAVGKGGRIVFSRETAASFQGGPEDVTVLLERGRVTLIHAAGSQPLKLKVGEVMISPSESFATQGEVAMLDGAIVVSAQEGAMKVATGGNTVEVSKGKVITLKPQSAGSPNPQGTHGTSSRRNLSGVWVVASLGAAGTAAILAGVAASRAGNARDLSNNANQSASQATLAATGAANAANLANQEATALGCGLDALSNALNPGAASPYTPPSGSC